MSTKNVCKKEVSYRDVYDQSLYDEALFEEYPDLLGSAISEGADAKDIFHHMGQELPPRRLGPREELTEAQKLSKLGAASAKIK
jgi:hypothetical protein